jgi:uncharacterized protein
MPFLWSIKTSVFSLEKAFNFYKFFMEVFNKDILKEIVRHQMPFGKYKGRKLCDLPISYLEWFGRKGGFPEGRLGMQMATVYEIKLNGLEEILIQLKNQFHT